MVYDGSRIYDNDIWRKMVNHVQVHKIMLRCVAVHYVHSTPVKMHSRSPTAMAFWPVCLGILAYSCQNTSRDTIFMKITTSSLRACAYLPARHDESLAGISCPCTWIPNFLYITRGGLPAYALHYPGFYYFLYVTTLPASDKVRRDGRKIKKSSQEVL